MRPLCRKSNLLKLHRKKVKREKNILRQADSRRSRNVSNGVGHLYGNYWCCRCCCYHNNLLAQVSNWSVLGDDVFAGCVISLDDDHAHDGYQADGYQLWRNRSRSVMNDATCRKWFKEKETLKSPPTSVDQLTHDHPQSTQKHVDKH